MSGPSLFSGGSLTIISLLMLWLVTGIGSLSSYFLFFFLFLYVLNIAYFFKYLRCYCVEKVMDGCDTVVGLWKHGEMIEMEKKLLSGNAQVAVPQNVLGSFLTKDNTMCSAGLYLNSRKYASPRSTNNGYLQVMALCE